MDGNPYAAPKSDITQADSATGRPGWVWVILILYIFSAISTIASFVLIRSGSIPIPEEQQRYLDSITAVDYAFSFLILGINVVAAVLLFRMRRSSFHFFMAGLFISLVYTTVHTVNSGWLQVSDSSGLVGMIGGYVVKVAICVYVWRLRNAGRLR